MEHLNRKSTGLESRWLFPTDSAVKSLPAVQDTQAQPLGREDPPEKAMVTHSSILAWEIHGQRSLEGYSSWDHKESDKIE